MYILACLRLKKKLPSYSFSYFFSETHYFSVPLEPKLMFFFLESLVKTTKNLLFDFNVPLHWLALLLQPYSV